jgi:hypothetical protein
MRQNILAIALAVPVALSCGTAVAQTSDTEARLREALRGSISQVRALEDERALLQAKQTESDKQIQALRAQVEALVEQAEQTSKSPVKTSDDKASRAEYEEVVGAYKQRLAAQEEALAKVNEMLGKWKTAYDEAANLARAKEAERVKLTTESQAFAQRATACEAKNVELFKVGSEILTRYANVDFSDVMAAREPFLGFKRVELQNLIQDYQDKLLESKAAQ